jgi:hypothetical protein
MYFTTHSKDEEDIRNWCLGLIYSKQEKKEQKGSAPFPKEDWVPLLVLQSWTFFNIFLLQNMSFFIISQNNNYATIVIDRAVDS